MIWGIILYYLWIGVALLMSFLYLRCCYAVERSKRTDMRVKRPVWQYIVLPVLAFIPGVNIFMLIPLIIFCSDDDVYVKSWLTKKL